MAVAQICCRCNGYDADMRTACGHFFHQDCLRARIQAYQAGNRRVHCPQCGRDLGGHDPHHAQGIGFANDPPWDQPGSMRPH